MNYTKAKANTELLFFFDCRSSLAEHVFEGIRMGKLQLKLIFLNGETR